MPSILSYMFARIIDIILLILIVFMFHKYLGSGMEMNIEDPGNLSFVLTLGFVAFGAGFSQAKMEK